MNFDFIFIFLKKTKYGIIKYIIKSIEREGLPINIIKFDKNHLKYASELFIQRYKEQRCKMNILPQKYESPDTVLLLLQEHFTNCIGVAAIENGKLVGYLIGLPVPNFKGSQRGIYCPEWAHAAILENRSEVYKKMYESASDLWVKNQCFNHAISLMADDDELINTWFWNGFGLHVIDAVRSLDLLSGNVNQDIVVRKCSNDDIESILPLLVKLQKHMAGTPIFIPKTDDKKAHDIQKWLENSDNHIWIGICKDEVISVMKVSEKISNDIEVLSDDYTVSIGETYTRNDYRGHGITKAMLQYVLTDSKLKGFKRCAVVFESQNISACTFWLKYFHPVCYSLVRKIDDRITLMNP